MILPPGILALQPPHVRAALERAGRPAKVARTKPRRKASQPAEPPSVAVVEGVSVTVVIPGLRLVSEANVASHEHWLKRHRRAKQQRSVVHAVLRSFQSRVALPLKVELVRIAPRNLDSDNLISSLKACRDGVSDYLGIADNDARVEWACSQEKPNAPRFYAVRVTLRPQESTHENA